MRTLVLLVAALAAQAGDCLKVDGDRITAGDLATAIPAFGAVSAETPIAPAPLPGVKRIADPRELLRWAGGANSGALPSGVCIERRSRQLAKEDVRGVLAQALGGATKIEVREVGGLVVEPAELEFSVSRLPRPATGNAVVLWRGRSLYDKGRRSLPVWVRVQISQRRNGLVAARAIPAGKAVDAADCRESEWEAFPLDPPAASVLADVLGRRAARALPQGTPIAAASLRQPRAVEPGGTVNVRVESGFARLEFQSKAETGGGTGDWILLKNPSTGKRFRGRIAAPGTVKVTAGEK